MNKWKDVWIKKGDNDLPINIQTLVDLDGYDTTSYMTSAKWVECISKLYSYLHLKPEDSLYEVGCGAGAVLYCMQNRVSKIGGLDYSGTLLKKARQILVSDDLREAEAVDISDEKYDVVIAVCSFIYFNDLDYAEAVLDKMIGKARRTVAVLVVNDFYQRDNIINFKRETYKDYNERYKDLNQLYFKKSWFESIAKKNNLSLDITDAVLDNPCTQFRYDAYFNK